MGLLILAAIAVGFGLGRLGTNSDKSQNRLVLYGNVDLRQVDLAFNNNERIAEVLVQEGAMITRGQVLARLDTSRLKPQMATAKALVDAQQAIVEKLHHGSRPQEIEQAQANVASAKADQVNAEQQWRRLTALTTLTTGRAISEQDLESAKAALDSAQARLAVAEKSLDLSRIGPRKEEVAQGEAQLRANESQLELLSRQLAASSGAASSSTRTPNSSPQATLWSAPGSWSQARWHPPKGRFSIWPSSIQSGSEPTYPSLIWGRFTAV